MIGNAMLGEYEQYSHAPSSKLVYNLHTLVFLGIVRRQGSCEPLRSKYHQTLSFSGTFPAVHQEVPLPREQLQRCSSTGVSGGFITSFLGVLQPQRLAGSPRCARTPAASSAGNEF